MSLDLIRERVDKAAVRSGREGGAITIVAVSKERTIAQILDLYEQGQRQFGENRAQELASKVPHLPDDINWHFVGPLQTNKVRLVRPVISLLHSLDRPDLITAWGRGDQAVPPALLQVNIGLEPQKHGSAPNELGDLARLAIESGVTINGLMAIPPLANSPEEVRPYFAEMASLRNNLLTEFPTLSELSMGMSDDYEAAIEEGSTMIRLGRAIFDRAAG